MLGTLKIFLWSLPLNNLNSPWQAMVRTKKHDGVHFSPCPRSASTSSKDCFLSKPFIKTSMMALIACVLIVLIKRSKRLAQRFCWWTTESRLKVPLFSKFGLHLSGLILLFIIFCGSPDPLLQSIAPVKYINKQTSSLKEARHLTPLIQLVWGYFFFFSFPKMIHLLNQYLRFSIWERVFVYLIVTYTRIWEDNLVTATCSRLAIDSSLNRWKELKILQ